MGQTNGEIVICYRDRCGATSIKSSNSEWVLILECISADGLSIRPLIIFKGKDVQKQWFWD